MNRSIRGEVQTSTDFRRRSFQITERMGDDPAYTARAYKSYRYKVYPLREQVPLHPPELFQFILQKQALIKNRKPHQRIFQNKTSRRAAYRTRIIGSIYALSGARAFLVVFCHTVGFSANKRKAKPA